MTNINLAELIAQREEATGVEGGRIAFDWGDKTFTFRDPLSLTDEEKEELADIEHDSDVAVWYMGEEQYDEFLLTEAEVNGRKVRGCSAYFMSAVVDYRDSAQDYIAGKNTHGNRSSRRKAARARKR